MLNSNSKEPLPLKGRRSSGKRRLVIIVLVVVVLCAAYWVKCRLGINVSSSMSASNIFPFKYLKDDVLYINKPGTVLFDDFDRFRFFSQWSELIASRHSISKKKVMNHGYGENSRCLQISFDNGPSWVCSFSKFISVRKGDVLRFEGLAYLVGDRQFVRMRVAAYDADRNAVDWRLVVLTVKKTQDWVKVEKRFTIEDDEIQYIKFQLVGGPGVFRFDNILLEMVSNS